MRLFLGGVRLIGDPYIKENITRIKYNLYKFQNNPGSRARNKKLKESTKDEHLVSKSPHRFSFCKKCKIVWNRDVNAGLNILKIGYQHFAVGDLNYTLRDL